MTRVRVVDNTDRFVAAMNGGVASGTIAAARKLRTFTRRKVAKKYKPPRRNAQRDENASRPGEPPKRRTGRGRRSIQAKKVGRYEAKTFANKSVAWYFPMYEFGPTRLRRPYLLPALRENKSELARIVVTPVRRRIRRGR